MKDRTAFLATAVFIGLYTSAAQSSESGEGLLIDIRGAPATGSTTAKFILLEFADYQCPMCAQFFSSTFRQIEEHYLDTGRLRYVFRDFPLESQHPLAMRAAEAAHCAGEQGKYWKMHDRLLRNQVAVDDRFLLLHAGRLALDIPAFERCLESGKHTTTIRESAAEGRKLGVNGTPWFFLGTDSHDSKMRVATVIRGAQPFPVFKQAIDKLLSRP